MKPSVERALLSDGDLAVLLFGAINSRSVGFRVNVDYAASFWHLHNTRHPFQALVCSARHGINWNLLQKLNRLAMDIHYSLYERFKV